MASGGPAGRRCPVCGDPMEGRHSQAIYCSDRCRSAAHRTETIIARLHAPDRTCPICGAPMAGKRSDARYCSAPCRVRAWRLREARGAAA